MQCKQFDTEKVLPRGEIEWNSRGPACCSRDKIVRGVRSICIHSRLVDREPPGTGSLEGRTRAPARRHPDGDGPSVVGWPLTQIQVSYLTAVALTHATPYKLNCLPSLNVCGVSCRFFTSSVTSQIGRRRVKNWTIVGNFANDPRRYRYFVWVTTPCQ